MIHRKSNGDDGTWAEGAAASSGIEDGERFAGPDPEPESVEYDSPENVEPVSDRAEPDDIAGSNLAHVILRKSRALDEGARARDIMDPYRRGKAALEKAGSGKEEDSAGEAEAKPQRTRRRRTAQKSGAESAASGVSPKVLDELLSGSRAPDEDAAAAESAGWAEAGSASDEPAAPEAEAHEAAAEDEAVSEREPDREAASDISAESGSNAAAAGSDDALQAEAVPESSVRPAADDAGSLGRIRQMPMRSHQTLGKARHPRMQDRTVLFCQRMTRQKNPALTSLSKAPPSPAASPSFTLTGRESRSSASPTRRSTRL